MGFGKTAVSVHFCQYKQEIVVHKRIQVQELDSPKLIRFLLFYNSSTNQLFIGLLIREKAIPLCIYN